MHAPDPSILLRLTLVALALGVSIPAQAADGTPPKLLKRIPPVYPWAMKHLGLEGTVEIAFVIDTEGNVKNPQVLRSNNPWFERPAIDSLLQWKFQPAVQGGRQVNTRAQQAIQFELWGGVSPWELKKSAKHKDLPPELRWDKPPQVVNSCFPVYPFEALQAKQAAKFVVSMLVDPTGHVAQVKIAENPPEPFAGAARAMAAMWEFKPATKTDGTPCFALIGIALDFRHDGTGTSVVDDTVWEIFRELARPNPRLVDAADLDAAPKEVTNRRVAYPVGLRAQGISGEAEVDFYIDREGDVQLPRVISATNAEFGHSAVLAAACWRFEPPLKDKRPVIAHLRRVVRFSLKN
jgi:TonB family protein